MNLKDAFVSTNLEPLVVGTDAAYYAEHVAKVYGIPLSVLGFKIVVSDYASPRELILATERDAVKIELGSPEPIRAIKLRRDR